MKPSFRTILTCTLIPLFLSACGKTREEGYEVRSGKVLWNSWRGDGLSGKWSEGVVTEDAKGFQILQQKTGEMNGYARNEKVVFYGPNTIDGADAKTFKLLDKDGTARDAEHVYSWGAMIEGADPDTFQRTELAHVGRDKKDFFYFGKALHVRDVASFRILQDADACSRQRERCIWARDKFDYYVDAQAKPIAHSESFQVIQSVYAKDNKNVYFGSSVLKGADATTFQGLGGESGEFTKDARRVYFHGEVLEGCDAGTFQLLGYRYAKDQRNAFFLYESASAPLVLPGSDARTFQVIGPSSGGFGYAKDARQVYYAANVVVGADPATFVVDSVDPENALDKNGKYRQGNMVSASGKV